VSKKTKFFYVIATPKKGKAFLINFYNFISGIREKELRDQGDEGAGSDTHFFVLRLLVGGF
jgi:hypothetical protein